MLQFENQIGHLLAPNFQKKSSSVPKISPSSILTQNKSHYLKNCFCGIAAGTLLDFIISNPISNNNKFQNMKKSGQFLMYFNCTSCVMGVYHGEIIHQLILTQL